MSDVPGAIKVSRGISSSGIHPGHFPNASASFVRPDEISSSNQHLSSRYIWWLEFYCLFLLSKTL